MERRVAMLYSQKQKHYQNSQGRLHDMLRNLSADKSDIIGKSLHFWYHGTLSFNIFRPYHQSPRQIPFLSKLDLLALSLLASTHR